MRKSQGYLQKALFGCRRSFLKALALCLSHLAAWGLFVALSVFIINHWGIWSLVVLLPFLVMLYAYRFIVSNRLLRLMNRTAPLLPFSWRLAVPAAVRLLTTALWITPFALMLYRFYQYVFVFPATKFSADFAAVGAVIAPAAALDTQTLLGTVIFFAALILSAVVFIFGQRRGISFDLAQDRQYSLKAAFRKARRMRKLTRGSRLVAAIINVLLLLPAVIIPLMIPMLQLYPLLSGKAMNDVQLIYVYLSAGIVSDGTLILAAVVFAALYLPLLPVRKLISIAAVTCHE